MGMNESAIVTFVVGEPYVSNWRKYCAGNWQAYAQKHGIDLLPIAAPLDESPRARGRSVSWQKCAALTHPRFRDYRQVALIDADVAINSADAPNIFSAVDEKSVGG